MIDQDIQKGFTNTITKDSYGGIVFCGINWGAEDEKENSIKLKEQLSDSEKSAPIAYFTSPINRAYKYQSSIIKWFRLWGHNLKAYDYGSDEDYLWCQRGQFKLEKCLSQTNVFLDSSPTANCIGRTAKDYNQAFERLARDMRLINPSLIIFFSTDIFFQWLSYLLHDDKQTWKDIAGYVHNRSVHSYGTHVFFDKKNKGNYFTLYEFWAHRGGSTRVIALNHPASRGKTDSSIASAGKMMRKYIKEALCEYDRRQITVPETIL